MLLLLLLLFITRVEPQVKDLRRTCQNCFFLHDWTRKVREFSVWVGYLTKWSLRVLSATINILIICLGLPVVWTYSPASDQTPSWRSSRLPSNSWRSFNRWPPRSQNLGYCCLVFPCSSTWRVWIFLLFAFVFAISLHKVFTCSMSLRNTNNSFASGFWRWIHVSSLPGELPTLTTGANLSSYDVGSPSHQTGVPDVPSPAFLPSMVAAVN